MILCNKNGHVYSYSDQAVLIDGKTVAHASTLKTAREYVASFLLSESFQLEQRVEPQELVDSDIALKIRETLSIQPTQTLVECVKRAVEQRLFLPINAVLQLREQTDRETNSSRITYRMRDNSCVCLTIENNLKLNTIIDAAEQKDLLLHMTENSSNFLNTARQLLKEQNG